MSYQMVPMYKCAICGKEKVSSHYVGKFALLPKSWTGSRRSDGDCYCEDCSFGIVTVRAKHFKEDE